MNTTIIKNTMSHCRLCPRMCGANRLAGEYGYCGQTAGLTAARAALHMWEEPCISGTGGSGAVFFSGCNMRCVFCQNHNIALGKAGSHITIEHLSEIFIQLQNKGAHNINLITPTHFIPQIREALLLSRQNGLKLPVVYNTGAYELPASLRMLEGLVDVYLPDLKYYSQQLSQAYSHAPDYFETACAALAEMYRQTKAPQFDEVTGLIKRGVIVRHLILPRHTGDSKKIIRYLHDHYGNDIYISIMNQYTPLPHVASYPELNRRVTPEEYNRVISFAIKLGVENGYYQEGDTAEESFIPDFNGEGLF